MPEGRHRPQRTCLGCRQAFDQSQLLRFVRSPEGDVLVDYRGKLPGRGGYTCLSIDCLRQAVARRQFDRTFKAPCRVSSVDALAAGLEEALRERLAALIGMARKSSQIVSGSSLVLDALERPERLAVVIVAEDISAGIAEKIEHKARSRGVPCLYFSTKADLGQFLGRGERSVTALTAGRLAETFLAEWQKLKEFQGKFDVKDPSA